MFQMSKDIKVPVKQRTSSFSDPLKYRVISDQMVNFSKTRAFEFLELNTFVGERSVKEKHVQFLFDEWVAGRFLWHHVLLACAVLDGKTYRVNGQHTCWMRVNIPDSNEPMKAEIREIRYKVDTEEQIRALYSTFDRNPPRSSGHVGKVMLEGTSAGADLNLSSIGKLIAGFKLYFCDDYNNSNSNINEIVGIITKNYPDLFNLVGRFYQIHRDDAGFVRRSSTIAAMFATFEKSVQPSTEFWTSVCEGIGLEHKSDQRWILRHFLETHGHTTQANKESVTQEDAFRVCINLWNKWRKKEIVSNVRYLDKRIKPI